MLPKQKGISFLLIDMASEGVSTTPIELISGGSILPDLFQDVRVPKENLVVNPIAAGKSPKICSSMSVS